LLLISVCFRVEDYQDANEDHVCLYKPLSNHSTPQQQVIRFSFAPRLKGFTDVQQLQVEASATPESTLVNVSLSIHSYRHSEECIKSDGGL